MITRNDCVRENTLTFQIDGICTPPGGDLCCDEILDELDEIKGKLRPIIVYKDRIVKEVVYIKQPPVVITKHCTKYITKTIEKLVYICNGNILPRPRPVQDQPVLIVCDISSSDCDNYRARLKASMINTKKYWDSKTDRKPYQRWNLSTYELNMDRNIDLGRPPGCDNKKIVQEVFRELYGFV